MTSPSEPESRWRSISREELVRLSYDVEVALFRIVQESLVNVVRYSVKPTVTVSIEVKVSDLILEVSDQGWELARGILDSRADDAARELGIMDLRKRLKQLGGIWRSAQEVRSA